MKKNIIFPTILLLSVASLQSCYHRIGKLTIVSTRNMDSKADDYVLLGKDVKGKGKTKRGDALESAIDNAVNNYKTGEFMKNVALSVSTNGKKIKAVGDVWGTAPTSKGDKVDKSVTKTVNAVVEFKIGDSVTYKNAISKLIEGIIVGTNQSTAVVEFEDKSKKEIQYEKLTKIER